LDRPKRGEVGEEEEEVEVEVEVVAKEAPADADAGMFVYSAVDFRFGCTGGGRSVVGREGDEGRD